MPRITFQPSGKTIVVPPGTQLAEACSLAGFALPMPCGGKGICGKCRVRIIGGGDKPACVTPAYGDLTLADPEEAHKGVILTDFAEQALAAEPGDRDAPSRGIGLAVDFGTTTLAAALCDLGSGEVRAVVSKANPQSARGDDVVTRAEYASRGETELREMQRRAIDAIQELAAEALAEAGLRDRDICRIAVGANTIMNHLLLGVDPGPLTRSPFTPGFFRVDPVGAETLGWRRDKTPSSPPSVLIVPNIAAFVGGDVTAGVIAHGVLEPGRAVLFLDIGTNGEIVLSANGKAYACAAAAGPAFEGARISQGMRAVPGAISRVSVDEKGELAVGVIGDGLPAKGLCGTGLLDAVAALARLGVIDETGQLSNNAAAVRLTESVSLTQKDVRELQLAKGAIAAGVRVLLEIAGLRAEDVGSVLLAGGFGNYLAPESVLATGLLPQGIRPEAIRPVGNAALAGTRLYLLSDACRRKAEAARAAIIPVELSGRDDFAAAFAEEMLFPPYSTSDARGETEKRAEPDGLPGADGEAGAAVHN